MLIALFLMSAFGTGIDKVLIALTLVGWVVYAARCAARRWASIQKGIRGRRPDVAGLRQRPRSSAGTWLPNVLTPLIVIRDGGRLAPSS